MPTPLGPLTNSTSASRTVKLTFVMITRSPTDLFRFLTSSTTDIDRHIDKHKPCVLPADVAVGASRAPERACIHVTFLDASSAPELGPSGWRSGFLPLSRTPDTSYTLRWSAHQYIALARGLLSPFCYVRESLCKTCAPASRFRVLHGMRPVEVKPQLQVPATSDTVLDFASRQRITIDRPTLRVMLELRA